MYQKLVDLDVSSRKAGLKSKIGQLNQKIADTEKEKQELIN